MTSPTEPRPPRAQIVGLGLIGTSIALGLKARGWRVSGSDLDRARAERALQLGAVDELGTDGRATVAFVATPVTAIAEVAQSLFASDRTGHLAVSDVAGVKAPVVSAVDHPRFVGGHPMAGSEQEGPDGADPELFAGSTWVLTPSLETDSSAFSAVRAVIGSLGAEVIALAPSRHDELVAMVSHVPHLTAAALMGLAAEAGESEAAMLRLAAGGFRDMTRVAAGSPGIWPDICRENAGAIVPVLDSLIERLGALREMVDSNDRGGLVRLLDHAQAARRNLPPRASRPAAVTELHVPIPDRPGVIAEVTSIAGELGVNIEDLEILHAADRPLGVMLLTVDATAADAVRRALSQRGLLPAPPGVPGAPKSSTRRGPVVAIDGPAGAGKSTVATALAARLGIARLDTGAMYRTLTAAILDAGMEPSDGQGAAELAGLVEVDESGTVGFAGRDLRARLRGPEVTGTVSVVSAHPAVRAVLVEAQRRFVERAGGAVVEGRDIGTVVLPDADLKVFLTAEPDERARRRALEEGTVSPELSELGAELERRDHLDSTRAASPLLAADDAIVVDSTGRGVDDVVAEVLSKL